MSDIRKYRGYIVPNRKLVIKDVTSSSYKWIIKFPDFPDVEIYGDDDMLMELPVDPYIQDCYKNIIDSIIELMEVGREVPVPQKHLDYKPFIDVEVDVALICQGLFFKLTN